MARAWDKIMGTDPYKIDKLVMYEDALINYNKQKAENYSKEAVRAEIEKRFEQELHKQKKLIELETMIAGKEAEIAAKEDAEKKRRMEEEFDEDDWDVPGVDVSDWNKPYVTQQAFEQINLELIRKGKKPMATNSRPQSEEVRIQALGAVGEKLVRWYLTAVQKQKITEAFDPMDSKKDFTFENGETAEIKTQSPYYNLHSFAVKDNQLLKMSTVDHIYFVETPRQKDLTSKEWTYQARQNYVNGSDEQKKAEDFECAVYVLHKADRSITEFITKKKVYAKDGTSRDMLLIPIHEMEVAFTITQPKHVILLDRYSTNPIGLIDA